MLYREVPYPEDPEAQEDFQAVDWKADGDEWLSAIGAELARHGLVLEVADTGQDCYAFRVVAAQRADR